MTESAERLENLAVYNMPMTNKEMGETFEGCAGCFDTVVAILAVMSITGLLILIL